MCRTYKSSFVTVELVLSELPNSLISWILANVPQCEEFHSVQGFKEGVKFHPEIDWFTVFQTCFTAKCNSLEEQLWLLKMLYHFSRRANVRREMEINFCELIEWALTYREQGSTCSIYQTNFVVLKVLASHASKDQLIMMSHFLHRLIDIILAGSSAADRTIYFDALDERCSLLRHLMARVSISYMQKLITIRINNITTELKSAPECVAVNICVLAACDIQSLSLVNKSMAVFKQLINLFDGDYCKDASVILLLPTCQLLLALSESMSENDLLQHSNILLSAIRFLPEKESDYCRRKINEARDLTRFKKTNAPPTVSSVPSDQHTSVVERDSEQALLERVGTLFRCVCSSVQSSVVDTHTFFLPVPSRSHQAKHRVNTP